MTLQTEIQPNPQPHVDVPSDPIALTFIVLFACSELIGSSKLKSNSVVQVAIRLLSQFKPIRKEDELVAELKGNIEDLTKNVEELRKAVQPGRARVTRNDR